MAPTTVSRLKATRQLLTTSASVIAISFTVLRLVKMFGFKKGYRKGPEAVGRRVDEAVGADDLGPEFDVVIVGGGTAGCVLAARLSEDPTINVLLLEAGGSGKARLESIIPGAFTYLFHSKHDYDLYTVEQPNAGGKKRYWPRGKLLGGCSSINAMMFHAGAPTDYDEWAQSGLEGSEEWAYKDFKKYFLKFEKFVPSKLFPGVDASQRGSDGPVRVGYFGHFSNFCSKWIKACENVGVPHAPDVNTLAGTLGSTKIMTYIDPSGRRVSTESAYLTQDVLNRPNLTVATGCQVTKVIIETKDGKKRAVGVEFARSKESPRYRVRAKKEVILSAGAIHSPQILMLSGVGPAEHLTSKSIPVIQDLPGVGQHLMDHPSLFVRFRSKRGESLNYLKGTSVYEHSRTVFALLRWLFTGKGPLTTNLAEAAAFLRSTDPKVFSPAEYVDSIEDTTSGEDAPDLEIFSSPLAWTEHGHGPVPEGDLTSLAAVLLRPSSLGTLSLNSSDPFDKIIIDPNYLATKHDVDVLVRGLKLCLRLARTEPLASLLDTSETDPELDHALLDSGDENIEKEVRKRIETLYHPTSTARMAPLAEGGVVDAYLRVYGVDALRVVDASIFPTIIAGHTAAPSIAVAEKAADIIKKQIKE